MAAFDRDTAQIMAILSLYTYLDIQRPSFHGMTLSEIVELLSRENKVIEPGSNLKTILDALKDPQTGPKLGRMRLVAQSHYSDPSLRLNGKSHRYADDHACMDDLLEGCAFLDEDGTIYLAYRGTGDGKWFDNGEGFSTESTDIQRAATRFFDDVYHRYGEERLARAYVAGHSKGGNEAQYVLMTSKYYPFIEGCYNFDGQGFSQAAIDSFKELEGFEERLSKLYSVNGAQDPVHDLLIPIALPENLYYLDCGPLSLEKIANVHDIRAVLTDGRLNWMPENDGHGTEGVLSIAMRQLDSAMLNEVDEHKRRHLAMGVMGLVELLEGEYRLSSVDDSEVTSLDFLVTLFSGSKLIIRTLSSTAEGREVLAMLVIGVAKYTLYKIPGYETVQNKLTLVLQERNIHSWHDLWQYLGENPVVYTLDLLKDFLGDFDTIVAVIKLSASAVVAAVVTKTVLLMLSFCKPILITAAVVVVCLLSVKIAIDFLKEHWDEIVSFAELAVDYARTKISEMVNVVIQEIRASINIQMTILFAALSNLAEGIAGMADLVKDALVQLPQLAAKVIDMVIRLENPLLHAILRAVTGTRQEAVSIDRARLEQAVTTMEQLATRVQIIDNRLDTLYGRLCEDSIEQGEGIFTSLARMYNLMRADISVDQGDCIRRKAKGLRSLYSDYSNTEKWFLRLLGG